MEVAGINIQQLFILKEISVWWLLPIFLSWLFIFLSKIKISFIHIILTFFSLNYVGIITYSFYYKDFFPAYIFAAGMLVYSFSILILSRIYKYYRYNFPKNKLLITKNRNTYALTITIFTLLVFLLSTLLFLKNGIPIFSKDPNIERHMVARGAGLFYRMIRFGLPFCFIILAVYLYLFVNIEKKIKYLLYLTIILTTIYSIFLGHKGALINITIVLSLLYTTFYVNKIKFRKYIASLILLTFISLISAVLIASKILNISVESSLYLILYRSTVMAGMGFFYTVHSLVPQKGIQYGLGHFNGLYDLLSSLRVVPRDENHKFFTLELTYFLLNPPPGVDIPFPTATTIFGDLYYEFGILGVLAGAFILAYISLWLYKKTKTTRSFLITSVCIYVQAFLTFLSNGGGLFGYVDSMIITLFVVLIFYWIIYFILKLSKRSKKEYKYHDAFG